MSKLEELEKIRKLKDSHILTQEEFEVEKYKILNEQTTEKKGKSKKKKAKLFFILTAIGIVITIICFILYNWGLSLFVSKIYMTPQEEMQMQFSNLLCDIGFYGGSIFGGISIIMLIIGIVFKVKEKWKSGREKPNYWDS